MNKPPFTDNKIRQLAPAQKRYSVTVDIGLSIRVMPSGIKSWVVRIPYNNRVIDITLGHFPEIQKRQACQLARRERQKYKLAPPKGYTFQDAYSLWKSLKKGEIVSYRSEKQRLEKYVTAFLANRQLDQITAPMVIQLLKPIEKSGKRATAKRCLMRIREIFDIAVCAGYLLHNPVIGVNRLFKTPKKIPRPALPWQELPEIIEVINRDANKHIQSIFFFSLYSMLRPGEVASLRWKWIDKNCLTIPAEFMKMKREHRVPLTDYALSLLSEAKKISKHKRSAYVFPGLKSSNPVNSQILTNFMRNHSFFKGRLVPHGLRSIARSWMADNNVSYEIAETCLAHTVGSSVSRAYQRSDFFDSRMGIYESWSSYIQDCAGKSRVITQKIESTDSLQQFSNENKLCQA
ncbi:tyrosine-type recombinase/integrase [Turicimonas sp. TL08]